MQQAGVNILNVHELAVGKLHALLSRIASRDLFDSHQLLTYWTLDNGKLRNTFTVYAGMRKNSWQEMDRNMIKHDIRDIRNKLMPVLQHKLIPGTKSHEIKVWADKLVDECRLAFQSVLPFNDNEKEFLSLLDRGVIKPDLLSSDDKFCQAVVSHPALIWQVKQKMKN